LLPIAVNSSSSILYLTRSLSIPTLQNHHQQPNEVVKMKSANEINNLMKDLRRAGVRSLKFVDKNTAIDQFGRKIVFKRVVVKGFLHTMFEITN